MELGFFTMPIHPPGRTLAETLEEDRELVLLADRPGLRRRLHRRAHHRCGGDHHVRPDLHRLAAARDQHDQARHRHRQPARTTTRRWSRPRSRCSTTWPRAASSSASARAACLRTPRSSATSTQDRTAMFVEAIDHILAIWDGTPPYDLEGPLLEHLDRTHADSRARPGHRSPSPTSSRIRRSS